MILVCVLLSPFFSWQDSAEGLQGKNTVFHDVGKSALGKEM